MSLKTTLLLSLEILCLIRQSTSSGTAGLSSFFARRTTLAEEPLTVTIAQGNLCLEPEDDTGNNVAAVLCDYDKKTQKWLFDPHPGIHTLQNLDHGGCIKADHINAIAKMSTVCKQDWQKHNWWFQDGLVESQRAGPIDYCLDLDEVEDEKPLVLVHECDESVDHQHFVTKTIPSKILTSDRAFCLGYDIKDVTTVLGLDCDDLDSQHTQEWQYDLGTLRIQNTYDNKCLDYNLGSRKIELFRCHDGLNQKWEYDGNVLKSKVEIDYQCLTIDTVAPRNAMALWCPSSPKSTANFLIVGKLEPFEACNFDHDCLSNKCGLKDANSGDLMCCSDETSVSLPSINTDNFFCGDLPPSSSCWDDEMCYNGACYGADTENNIVGTCKVNDGESCTRHEDCLNYGTGAGTVCYEGYCYPYDVRIFNPLISQCVGMATHGLDTIVRVFNCDEEQYQRWRYHPIKKVLHSGFDCLTNEDSKPVLKGVSNLDECDNWASEGGLVRQINGKMNKCLALSETDNTLDMKNCDVENWRQHLDFIPQVHLGGPCSESTQCKSNVCGFSSAKEGAPKICCEDAISNGEESYCTELVEDEECFVDSMCESELCFNLTSTSNGICSNKKNEGDLCTRSKECYEPYFSCGLHITEDKEKNICCEEIDSLNSIDYCKSMEEGSKCYEDWMCTAPLICFNATMSHVGECKPKEPNNENCIHSKDCLSNSCGLDSDNVNATRICCSETIKLGDKTYCENQVGLNATCLSNDMCQTGLVCYGSPVYDPISTLKGVCAREGDIGSVCLFNEECSSSVCALFSMHSTRKLCCDSSMDHNGEEYCSQLPDTHKCAFDDMCLHPRVCYGSTISSSGICQSQVSSGVCIRDAECVGSCGNNVTHMGACCSTVYPYGGKHYCKDLDEDAPCYFDATCGSLICLGAKNDGSTVGVCSNKVSNEEECSRDVECSSGSCGLKSPIGLENEGYICCSSKYNNICGEVPDGAQCKYDQTCASEICFKKEITDDIGICRGKMDIGEQCESDFDCQSNQCAFEDGNEAKLVCCSSHTSLYDHHGGYDHYCVGLPDEAACKHPSMCVSGKCVFPSSGSVGKCVAMKSYGEECVDYEGRLMPKLCPGDSCGLSSAKIGAKSVCCEFTHSYLDQSYCSNLDDGLECKDDDMCVSNFCFRQDPSSPNGICAQKLNVMIDGVIVITHGTIPYGSTIDGTFVQDFGGDVVTEGDTKINMYGNAWKAFEIQDSSFKIQKDTEITFDFTLQSFNEAEGHAICLEEDLSEDTFTGGQVRCIALSGKQISQWENVINSNFDSNWITNTVGDKKTYKIPLGLLMPSHITVKYIAFIQDNDSNPSSGESSFSDINLYNHASLNHHILYEHVSGFGCGKGLELTKEECLVAGVSSDFNGTLDPLQSSSFDLNTGIPLYNGCSAFLRTIGESKQIHFQQSTNETFIAPDDDMLKSVNTSSRSIHVQYYDATGWDKLSDKNFNILSPLQDTPRHFVQVVNYPDIDDFGDSKRANNVAAYFRANLTLPVDKKICVWSDDGSLLYVDGVKKIDNDENHPLTKVSVPLSSGTYTIELEYYNRENERGLYLTWGDYDCLVTDIIPAHFFERHPDFNDDTAKPLKEKQVLDFENDVYETTSYNPDAMQHGQVLMHLKATSEDKPRDGMVCFVDKNGKTLAVFLGTVFGTYTELFYGDIDNFLRTGVADTAHGELHKVWSDDNPLYKLDKDGNWFRLSWSIENHRFTVDKLMGSKFKQIFREDLSPGMVAFKNANVRSLHGAEHQWKFQALAPMHNICRRPFVTAKSYYYASCNPPKPDSSHQIVPYHQSFKKKEEIPNIDFPLRSAPLEADNDYTHRHFHGFLSFPDDGSYTLRFQSSFGAIRLFFDRQLKLDVTCSAKPRELSYQIAALTASVHEIDITYGSELTNDFQAELILQWKTPFSSDFVTIPASSWLPEKLHMACYASPHTDIENEKCVCREGYISSHGTNILSSIQDLCVNSAQSDEILVLPKSIALKLPIEASSTREVKERSLTRKDVDMNVEVTLDRKFRVVSRDDSIFYEFNFLTPGQRYYAHILLEDNRQFDFSSVTSCACDTESIDKTGKPQQFMINQRNGHVMFSFIDSSYCEEAYSFTRTSTSEEFIGDVSLNGDIFTSDFYFSSGKSCGLRLSPQTEASDNLRESNLPVGGIYSYCVRAVHQIKYMEHPYSNGGLNRALTSSDDTCRGHQIRWESSITGIITTEPTAGKLPIEDVTVTWKIMNTDGKQEIDCAGCTGETKTNEGGVFKIVFNENHEAFHHQNAHEFPVLIHFKKTTLGPDGDIEHKFLCNEGEDNCSGEVGTKVYLSHLKFEEPLHIYDDTSIVFSGNVIIADTNGCVLPNVEICLLQERITGATNKNNNGLNKANNTLSCGTTDINGMYSLPVIIGSRVDYVDLSYNDHEFQPSILSKFESGRLIDAGGDYRNNDFVDVQKARLIVEVVGGRCDIHLGTSTVKVELVGCPWEGKTFVQTRPRESYEDVPAHLLRVQVLDIRDSGGRVQHIWDYFQGDEPLVRTINLEETAVADSVLAKEGEELESHNKTSNKGLEADEERKQKEEENLEEIEEKEEEEIETVRFQYDGRLQLDVTINGDQLGCNEFELPRFADSIHVIPYMTIFSYYVKFKFEINKMKNQYCSIVDSEKYKLLVRNHVGVDNNKNWDQFFASISDERTKNYLEKCKEGCSLESIHDVDDRGIPTGNARVFDFLATGRPSIFSPYIKYLDFGVTNAAVTHKAAIVVSGYYSRGAGGSFSLPTHKPIMVLRDPPGGLSYSSYSNIKTTFSLMTSSTTTSLANTFGLGLKKEVTVDPKVCKGGGVGAIVLLCNNMVETDSVSNLVDFEEGLGGTIQMSEKANSVQFSTTWSYETSGDSWIAGKLSDVFVVPNLNVLYDRVIIVNWDDDLCAVETRNGVLPETTTFDINAPTSQEAVAFYSRFHILSVTLPELKKTRAEKDQKLKDCACDTPDPVYTSDCDCSTLNDNLLSINEGIDGWEVALKIESELLAKATKDASLSINNWFENIGNNDVDSDLQMKEHPAKIAPPSLINNSEKLDNTLLSNEEEDKPIRRIQYSGGGSIFSMELSKERTWEKVNLACWEGCSVESDTSIAAVGLDELTMKVLGAGIRTDLSLINLNLHVIHESTKTTSDTEATSITFSLGDDDHEDYFAVDLFYDEKYGTIIFKTVAGQSKCPNEEGTLAIEDPTLKIHTPSSPVYPEEDMIFNVEFGNAGVRPSDFFLYINHVDNPNGLQLSIDGISMGGKMEFWNMDGAPTKYFKVLTVRKGPIEYEYSPLNLVIEGTCENDNTVTNFPLDQNGEEVYSGIMSKTVPIYNDIINQKIKFVEPCPKVEWAGELKRDDTFLVNTASDSQDFIIITIFNPAHGSGTFSSKVAKEAERLESVRLNYRKVGDKHWSIARTIAFDDAGDSLSVELDYGATYAYEDTYGYSFMKWMFSHVREGSYEVKIETKCNRIDDGPSDFDRYSTPILSGVIDFTRPEQYGKSLPLREFVLIGEEMTFIFTEALHCEKPLSFDVRMTIEDTSYSFDTDELKVMCEGHTIGVQLDPVNVNGITDIMGKRFTIEIGNVGIGSESNVFDLNGNGLERNVKIEKTFANVDLDEASVSFTIKLIDAKCAAGAVAAASDAILDEVEDILQLSKEKDRMELKEVNCIDSQAIASVKIKPPASRRRLRLLASSIDDYNRRHSVLLFQDLRNESELREKEWGENSEERKLLQGQDKKPFTVSNMKILPCPSDIERLKTSQKMIVEEEEMYRVAASLHLTGEEYEGNQSMSMLDEESDKHDDGISNEIRKIHDEMKIGINREEMLMAEIKGLRVDANNMRVELMVVSLACIAISVATLVHFFKTQR